MLRLKKYDIVTYEFPETTTENIEESQIIKDYHRAVVLHTRTTPYKSILLAPITKAAALDDKDNIPSNYVPLKQEDYFIVLEHDSYINLDMTRAVDNEELKLFEKYGKSVKASLNSLDQKSLDYRITLTYELSKYITGEIDVELEREFKNVIEYIDEDIKNRIKKLVDQIEDKNVANAITEIIDDLIYTIREEYLKK